MEKAAETTIFLLKPFFIGLYIGIFIALFVFIREKAAARKLKKEIEKLKAHIQSKLEIEAESAENRKREVEELKRQNENLRVSLLTFSEKPGRREIKQLHLYQKAVEILTEKAPGFAQSWQSALHDGEVEMKRIHLGAIPFVRRLLPGTPSSRKSIEGKSGK
ncbi:MAG: hypothetical protein JXQ30_05620 [Spirochaetes bacterium]|nr:hypothetical protein [Spirochaetota bacterium]